MRYLLLPLIVVSLLPLGCSVNQQFVGAVESALDVLEPEYIAYVRADPELDAQSKAIRERTVMLLRQLIIEAKGNTQRNLLLEVEKQRSSGTVPQ